MKKTVFFVSLVVLFFLVLIGCSDGGAGTTTQYYYEEAFTITITDYESVPWPVTPTFTSIKEFRDSLRDYRVEFLGSGTDTTEQEIYDALTQSGMTPTEANNEISFLNDVGNNLAVFELATDSSLYVIIYVEKL